MLRTSAFIAIGLGLVNLAAAECPNACSGHGTCGSYDACSCFRLWQGNDCSMRSCPFDFAHVDSPKGDLDGDGVISGSNQLVLDGSQVYPLGTHEQYPGYPSNNNTADEAHYYMECSNKGICDRSTGACECFVGYEGSACQRTSCPNDCSGHGTCETIEEMSHDLYKAYDYNLWDRTHTRGCACDHRWSGPDCSERQCDHGVDPLYLGSGTDSVREPTYEIVAFETNTMNGELSGYFSLTYYDIFGTGGQKHTTEPIAHGASAAAVASALEALPNDVIPDSSITGLNRARSSGGNSDRGWQYQLMLSGNPGDLNDVVCDASQLVVTGGASADAQMTPATCVVGQPFSGQGVGNATCDIDLSNQWQRSTDGSNTVLVKTNGTCPSSYNQHLVNEEVGIYNHLFSVVSWWDDTLTLSCENYPESQELDGDHVPRCVEINDITNRTSVAISALVNYERAVVPFQQGTSTEYFTKLATTQMDENQVGTANTMRVTCAADGQCDFTTSYVSLSPTVLDFGFGPLDSTSDGLYNLELNGMQLKIGQYIFTVREITVVSHFEANVFMTTSPFASVADKKAYKMVDPTITTVASNPSSYNTILTDSSYLPVFVTIAATGSSDVTLDIAGNTHPATSTYIPVSPTTFKILGTLYSVTPDTDNTATVDPVWQGHSFDHGFVTEATDLAQDLLIWQDAYASQADYHPVLLFSLDSDAAVDTMSDGYAYVAECSNRGLCDVDSGVCECFKGYSGGDCGTVNALHV